MTTRLMCLVLASLLLVACTSSKQNEVVVLPSEPAPTPTAAGQANPAAAYCQSRGHKWELREEDGGSYGVCIFAGGSECDEWAYFVGECQPGRVLESPSVTPEAAVTAAAPATAIRAADGWQIYRNETPAYSFLYPAEAAVEPGNDPQQAVTIAGPLVEDELWPMFYIGHPQDRVEYRPPENVELATWLVEQNLLAAEDQPRTGEVRQEQREIAGQTAVHTRFERSDQSYAYDKYFFARAGQLYTIIILHTGDREDWDLYNHFLDSFQFEDTAAADNCPEVRSGTILLRSDEYGYCLLLPEEYLVDDSLTSEGGGAETAVYRGSPLDAAHARLFITIDDAQGQTLEAITLAREAEIEGALPGFDLAWAAGPVLDGELTNELAQVPGQDLSRQMLLLHGGRLYTLVFIPDDPDRGQAYEEMQLLYATMIESFRFSQR